MKPMNWFGAVAVMALVPTCWLPTVRQPAGSGDQQSAGIVRQSGVSHMVFRQEAEYTGVSLVYVRTDATGESRETIPAAIPPTTITRPTLAVTADGVVHAIWGCGAEICHAQRAVGGGWAGTPPAPADTPLLVAAAAAPGGDLHVAWQSKATPGVISYRRWASGVWQAAQTAIRISSANTVACDDLNVADLGGQPSIVVACEDPGAVKYAHRDADGTWREATLHEGPASAADIAVGAKGPVSGSTGEQVIWCAGTDVKASAIVRPLFGPLTAAATGLGSAVCAPGSAAVGAGGDGTVHAVFAGPIYYTDPGPAQRPLVYARLAPGSDTWTDIGIFCKGRPPYPLQHVGVSGDASGVSVSWESWGGPSLAHVVRWTQGVAGPLASACSAE